MRPFGVRWSSTAATHIYNQATKSAYGKGGIGKQVDYLQFWEICLDVLQTILRGQNGEKPDLRG
jgi:hypothetical protein